MSTIDTETKSPKSKGWLPETLKWLGKFEFVTGIIIGIAATSLAGAFWIKDQARDAVREPQFVEELSKLVRPFLIVDSHGTVSADYGACEEIDGFKFEVSTNKYEMKIVLSFKRHMNTPPTSTAFRPTIVSRSHRTWESP